MIHLFSMGQVPPEILEELVSPLCSIFDQSVKIQSCTGIPSGNFDSDQAQYSSADFLDHIRRVDIQTEPEDKILGVTDVDLYAPGLHFVFGEARLKDGIAVISLHRLRPEFYGHSSNLSLFKRRILKEAVHELGHTFQLVHCHNELCVMHFSDTIRDTDRKDWRFCGRCLPALSQKFSEVFPQDAR